jgi:hypothetical protein
MKIIFTVKLIIETIVIIIIIILDTLQKSTGVKEELSRKWQLNAVYVVPLVLYTIGIIPQENYRIA